MHLLGNQEAKAWETENTEEAQRLLTAQKEFLSDHLLR